MMQLEPSAIQYLDDLVRPYEEGLNQARTLPALKRHLSRFKWFAADACDAVEGWSSKRFKEWRTALALERQRRFMGEDRARKFGVVLLPAILLHVGVVAQQYGVPDGTAYKRLVDVRALGQKNGRLVWQSPKTEKAT